MSGYTPPRRIVITGGFGNLGTKLIHHLMGTSWCESVVALDRTGDPKAYAHYGARVAAALGDLRDWRDRNWRDALKGAEAAVHFAAQRPYDDATWTDVAASIDMTANLLEAAAAGGLKRIVFATSNHVMGGYKDPPLADTIGPGKLSPDSPPAVGTITKLADRLADSTPYASAKLAGERLCVAKALASGGTLTAVAIRIGWCQPGENRPQTLNLSGSPSENFPLPRGQDERRALRWFRNMWLSNRDFLNLHECALTADPAAWPAPGIVVNGMSDNRGMAWDLEPTRRLIGYAPQDNIWAHVN